ncbi:hypothetical protein ACFPVT_05195 [Corynebacterium choanae]|uniref:hypothetical protein n=1 Tax=Corynebacterium choanae TaxID=1862358 RepID=UPI000F4FA62B|nr:hypothetical protein [Corynebacterium choanae]
MTVQLQQAIAARIRQLVEDAAVAAAMDHTTTGQPGQQHVGEYLAIKRAIDTLHRPSYELLPRSGYPLAGRRRNASIPPVAGAGSRPSGPVGAIPPSYRHRAQLHALEERLAQLEQSAEHPLATSESPDQRAAVEQAVANALSRLAEDDYIQDQLADLQDTINYVEESNRQWRDLVYTCAHLQAAAADPRVLSAAPREQVADVADLLAHYLRTITQFQQVSKQRAAEQHSHPSRPAANTGPAANSAEKKAAPGLDEVGWQKIPVPPSHQTQAQDSGQPYLDGVQQPGAQLQSQGGSSNQVAAGDSGSPWITALPRLLVLLVAGWWLMVGQAHLLPELVSAEHFAAVHRIGVTVLVAMLFGICCWMLCALSGMSKPAKALISHRKPTSHDSVTAAPWLQADLAEAQLSALLAAAQAAQSARPNISRHDRDILLATEPINVSDLTDHAPMVLHHPEAQTLLAEVVDLVARYCVDDNPTAEPPDLPELEIDLQPPTSAAGKFLYEVWLQE